MPTTPAPAGHAPHPSTGEPTAGARAGAPTPRRPAADRREELLEATIDVVARQGLRALTLRAVAQEVGVSHPLVAHHFGTRDHLVEAAVRHSMTRTESIATPQTPSGQVEDFALGAERIAAEEPLLQAFQYEMILESTRRADLAPHIHQLYAEWRGMAQEAMEQIGIRDAETVGRLVFAAMDGLVFEQLVLGTPEETAEAMRVLRTMIRLYAEHEASD